MTPLSTWDTKRGGIKKKKVNNERSSSLRREDCQLHTENVRLLLLFQSRRHFECWEDGSVGKGPHKHENLGLDPSHDTPPKKNPHTNKQKNQTGCGGAHW